MSEDCHCGPGWFPQGIKRILSKKFNVACQHHDQEYRLQTKSKPHADSLFFNEMLELCQCKKDVLNATLMFIAVKLGGWSSWYRNKFKYFYRGK